jgi:ABC-type polysaccharide/polyol phosphate export permease
MQPKDIIGGYFISNTAMIMIQFGIGITVLSFFGFSPIYADPLSVVFGFIITIFLLSFFQNGLAMVISSVVKRPEATGGAIWVVLIPMMTFSGSFFPLEVLMPNLIPYVAWIPTRIVVIILQDLMINAVSISDPAILLQFLWLALEGLLFFWIGMKSYRQFARST